MPRSCVGVPAGQAPRSESTCARGGMSPALAIRARRSVEGRLLPAEKGVAGPQG